MTTHSPYKPTRRPKPKAIYANLFELSDVVKFWDHKRRSRLNQQRPSDQLRLMTLAGALHGGGQVFLTVNLEGRRADRVIEGITDTLARTGWKRRYVAICVPDSADMHDHIHVILFDVGPGTEARRKLKEIALRERDQHPNRTDVRQVRTLPGLVSYLYGRNVKRDGGRITCDKQTRAQAEAISGLSPADLWKEMRDALPEGERTKWPELPPILTDREEGATGTADTRRKKQKARAKRAYERDQRRRAVAAIPEPGAFDVLDEIEAAAMAATSANPEPNCFDVLDEAEPGAFDLLDDLSTPPGAYDLLDDLKNRPAALAGESGPATAARVALPPEIARPESVFPVSGVGAGRAVDPLLAMFRRVDEFRPSG